MSNDAAVASGQEYLRRINAALALREVPDWPAALEQLSKALQLNPADTAVYILSGLTYQDIGNIEQAENNFRQALILDPESEEAQQSLGLLLVQEEKYAEAIELLRPLADEDEHNLPVWQALILALENTKHRWEAADRLTKIFEHFPDELGVGARLGRLLLELNKVDKAAEILEKVAEVEANAEVLCDLSAGYVMQRKFDVALKILEDALKIDPNYDRIWRGVAHCQLRLRNINESLTAANKALELNSDHYRNWQAKADTLGVSGHFAEAIPALSKAIELANIADNQQMVSILAKNRISALKQSVDNAAAMAQIDQDFEDYPYLDRMLLSLKRNILFEEERFVEALDVIQAAEQAGVPQKIIIPDYFYIYQALERPDEALTKVQEYLAVEPENQEEVIARLSAVGVDFYRNNNIAVSKEVFRQLLTIVPGKADIATNLAFILIGEGPQSWAEAENLLQQAIKTRGEHAKLALTNLGYIRLRQQNYQDAVGLLQEALAKTTDDSSSILRIACWSKKEISQTDVDLFPKRIVPTRLSVLANLAIAQYLNGEPEVAFKTAHIAIKAQPRDNIGYRVFGCLCLADNQVDKARDAWEEALEQRKSKAEAELIQSWLNDLPPNN